MKHSHPHADAHAPANSSIDPVCGMTVKNTSAHAADHQGQRYVFCSAGCRTKFLAEPMRYLKKSIAQASQTKSHATPKAEESPPAGKTYTCPMHPEVQQSGPGSCPKCGMALEPMIDAGAATSQTEWICPMHPEIVRAEPGACPICGMALEPRTVSLAEEDNTELKDMTRRFWISLVLTTPLLALVMGDMFSGHAISNLLSPRIRVVVEFLLAAPVCLWAAWPFYVRAVASIRRNRSRWMTCLLRRLAKWWI